MSNRTTEETQRNNRIGQVVLGCTSLCILDGLDYGDGIIVAKAMQYACEMINNNPNRPDDVDAKELEVYIYKLMEERKHGKQQDNKGE